MGLGQFKPETFRAMGMRQFKPEAFRAMGMRQFKPETFRARVRDNSNQRLSELWV